MEQVDEKITTNDLVIAFEVIKKLEKESNSSNRNAFTQVRNLMANKIAERFNEMYTNPEVFKNEMIIFQEKKK